MKINGVNHAKIHQLAEWIEDQLELPYELCQTLACGLIERMIDFTHHSAPRGDIGRYPNRTIARKAGWSESADELIEALTRIGWLDLNQGHRLVVHDWSHHAMPATRLSLQRRGEATFADGAPIRRTQSTDPDDHGSRQCHDRDATASEKSLDSSSSASVKLQSPDTEKNQMSPAGAGALALGQPPGEVVELDQARAPSPEAVRLFGLFTAYMADCHPSAKVPTTEPQRAKWRGAFDRMMRGKNARAAPDLESAIEWLQNENPKREYAFVVQCPKALDEKFDRIAAQMARPRLAPARGAPKRGFGDDDDWAAYDRHLEAQR